MTPRTPRVLLALAAAQLVGSVAAQSADSMLAPSDWPQFRGAHARGIADGHALPVTWDLESGANVLWKTAVPGLAHASPIVAGDRVFVASAVAKGIEPELKVGLYGAGDSAADMVEHAFVVMCLDRASGEVLWQRTARSCVPQFARHTKATHCDPTPVTDGTHVVALFGSEGLFCYDLDGELKWHADVGELDVGPHDSMDLHWGYASSPIIADGKVFVQADVKKAPYLAAFDVKTGEEVWRVARDDLTGWCTPTAHVGPDGLQILVNGCKHMGAYRGADGEELWRMAGGGGIPVPAPVVDGGLVYLTSNHRPINPRHPLKPIFVVELSAQGDLGVPSEKEPGEHVAWTRARFGSYMQTPLVYRGVAYFGKLNGVVYAFDAKTGEDRGKVRLGEGRTGFSASAVAGDGKLYYTSEEGDIYVVRVGEELEILDKNAMGEVCMATPAVSRGTMFFRTRGHVVAVGNKSE